MGDNNSSSNSHNNASNNSSNSNIVFQKGKNTASVGNGTENWGGSRAGAGRKPNASMNMHVTDTFNEDSGSSSEDISSKKISAAAKKREVLKKETTRLLEIEEETCRTRGSGLTVETCLIVTSLFTQRIREAISVKGIDSKLYGSVIDYEKDPPYKFYSQIAKEFHMRLGFPC